MNIFTILSDLLKLEKLFAIFGVIVFSGVLSIDSKYVPSEGLAGAGMGASPFAKPVLLLQYGVEGISLLLMLLRWKTVVRAAVRDPFLWGIAILAVLSSLWSDFSGFTRNRAISTLLTAMFGVYLGSRFSLKEQLNIIAWALGLTSVFSLLYTGAFRGAGIEQGVHAGAWRGPFIQKNIFARIMACTAIPIVLTAMDNRKYRYLLWGVFGITAFLIFTTRSKTGQIIFLSLMLLVPLFKAMRWKGGLMIPFLSIIVLVASSTITWLVESWEPFLYGLGKDPSLSGRTYVWEASIDKIEQRPWLGYGYQAFWKTTGGAEYVWTAVGYPVSQAHNGFINMALDLGLVGLVCFVLSLITMYIRGIALVRLTKSSAELWPLLYTSFLILYNQTESTIIEHNNLFWVLHFSVSLSIGYIRAVRPEEFSTYPKKKGLSKNV